MLDANREELVTNPLGHELGSIVGLQTLDGERDAVEDQVEEVEGVGCGVAGIQRGHQITRTIFDKGVLIEASRQLHRVHLHPFT